MSAADARQHILNLRKLGVGRRAIAAAGGLNDRTIFEIASGRRPAIFTSTEKAILAVDRSAVRPRALVPAHPTWVRLHSLIAEGLTKKEIARRLGYKMPALQIKTHRVIARNEKRIERLFTKIERERSRPVCSCRVSIFEGRKYLVSQPDCAAHGLRFEISRHTAQKADPLESAFALRT